MPLGGPKPANPGSPWPSWPKLTPSADKFYKLAFCNWECFKLSVFKPGFIFSGNKGFAPRLFRSSPVPVRPDSGSCGQLFVAAGKPYNDDRWLSSFISCYLPSTRPEMLGTPGMPCKILFISSCSVFADGKFEDKMFCKLTPGMF